MATESTGFRLSPQQRQICNSVEDVRTAWSQLIVTIDADVDYAALESAVAEAIAQHEILRTTYAKQAGSRWPLQVVHDTLSPDIHQEDHSDLSGDARSGELQDIVLEDQRPFDLEHGPVFRVFLIALEAHKAVLVITLPALSADRRTLITLAEFIQAKMTETYEKAGEEPLQYADYAAWQNEVREAGDEAAMQGQVFWQAITGDGVFDLLPFADKSDLTGARARHSASIALSPETAAAIEKIAQSGGTSPDAVLMATWQALLFRLSGKEDFVIGRISESRNYDEVIGACGRYSRTLPMQCSVSDTVSFTDLLSAVSFAISENEKYQDYAPEGDSYDLFVGFEAYDAPESVVAAGNLTASEAAVPFAIKLLICGLNDIRLIGHSRQVASSVVEIMAGHFSALVASVVMAPAGAVGSLNLLSNAERLLQLETWNATESGYPSDQTIHVLFEAQAVNTPQAKALVGDDASYTYADLNAAANRLAHCLQALGVIRGARVGLLMERSAAMVVGLLGILKAGGAYVPLPPDVPVVRLQHVLTEAGAKTVVTTSSLTGLLSDFPGDIVRMDADAVKLLAEPDTNPASVNTSDDLVYVIYTSGSTGQPKGVENTHRGLVNYASYINRVIHDSGLNYASVSPLTADLGNTCVFPSLIGGGTLHMMSYETGMDASKFASYVQRHGIDVLKITPSHLSALLGAADGAGVLPGKILFLGGEASSPGLIARIRSAGNCRIINHYGPTETTVGSLTYKVPDNVSEGAYIPIGRPIANTQAYILNSCLSPCPTGVAGELYIGGHGVARGYMARPDLTSERFIPSPFTDGKLYKTGDLARYLSDGSIEFLGRMDDQIKIRGFRVEPQEIEIALRSHSSVSQAVVLTRDDIAGDKRLIAYIVPETAEATPENIKLHLQGMLPDYMVPRAIVLVEAIPLTSNGKVDRTALPDPDTAGHAGTGTGARAETSVEVQLEEIWADILGIDQVAIDEDFFDLGGHSLMAIQVMSRVREIFQVEMPMNTLFDAPTIRELAKSVESALASASMDLESLIDDLDSLSDEEAEALLAMERSSVR